MSLKAQSICFRLLKEDRLGEAIVCCQYPAIGVWQADCIDFLCLNINRFPLLSTKD